MHANRDFIRIRAGGAAAMALLVIGTSCSAASESTPTGSVVTSDRPSPSASTASAGPTATQQPAVPPEWQATWQATISTGEEVTLTLGRGRYAIGRGPAAGYGSIKVNGSQMVFNSVLCDLGPGAYEWSIVDGALTFTPLEPRDPCVNRIIFLEDAIYTRTG